LFKKVSKVHFLLKTDTSFAIHTVYIFEKIAWFQKVSKINVWPKIVTSFAIHIIYICERNCSVSNIFIANVIEHIVFNSEKLIGKYASPPQVV